MSSTPLYEDLFFLIDGNAFFVSCEEVFNPKIRNKPVVVLSNNDGCVIARSKEAKALGIRMGGKAYEYKTLFEKKEVFVFSSNFALYADMSLRVLQTLYTFSDAVEPYSIDEAFMLIKTKDPKAFAKTMKKRIHTWTGIPVSIGIAPTKTLAKVASEIAKNHPDGIYALLDSKEIRNALEELPIQEVWGIGGKLGLKLRSLSIKSAQDLCLQDTLFIKKRFGVMMQRLQLELQGKRCQSSTVKEDPKQSIISSRSFGRPLSSLNDIEESMAYFAKVASHKLKKGRQRASSLTCFLMQRKKGGEPIIHYATMLFPEATQHTSLLSSYAKRVLQNLFQEGCFYKKAGLIVHNLSPQEEKQPDLLVIPLPPQKEKAWALMEEINRSFGKETLRFAAEGVNYTWKGKKENVSPEYTTRLDQLLTIYI